MMIVPSQIISFLYVSLAALTLLMILQIVFFNLNTKMTEGQFAIVVTLKIVFTVNALLCTLAEIEYFLHNELYEELSFIETVPACINAVLNYKF